MERYVDLADVGTNNIYKIYILTAMNLLHYVWQEISATAIINCWRTTRLITRIPSLPAAEQQEAVEDSQKSEQNITEFVAAIVPESKRISIQVLDAEEKVTCTGIQMNIDAIKAILSSFNGIPVDEDAINKEKSQDTQSKMELVRSTLEVLAGVGRVKRFSVACGDNNGVIINQLCGLQKTLHGFSNKNRGNRAYNR